MSPRDLGAHAALDRAARTARGRLVGALTARLGPARLDLVETVVQEAMLRALERWPQEGVPDNPAGWLFRAAHNLAIDALRREARVAPSDGVEPAGEVTPRSPLGDELPLLFLCCHPTLTRAAQIALTLQLGCGFGAAQIARAFLTDEATVAQRLVRAKRRLREENPAFEVPDADEIPARLDVLLDVIYLLFNEGHTPTDDAESDDLCGEALRLVSLLTAYPRTATPPAHALAALLCFQAARLPARFADDGSLLLLPEQDRARWNQDLIAAAFAHLQAAAHGDEVTRFHLEAGIAACHAQATAYATTDWQQIRMLYDALRVCAPSPVVDVNRALAVAMVDGPLAGLDELDAIPERGLLDQYPYAQAAYAELHAALGHIDEASAHLRRALAHQPARAQRALLERKLGALTDAMTVAPCVASTRLKTE